MYRLSKQMIQIRVICIFCLTKHTNNLRPNFDGYAAHHFPYAIFNFFFFVSCLLPVSFLDFILSTPKFPFLHQLLCHFGSSILIVVCCSIFIPPSNFQLLLLCMHVLPLQELISQPKGISVLFIISFSLQFCFVELN